MRDPVKASHEASRARRVAAQCDRLSKICLGCGQRRALAQFRKQKQGIAGRRGKCKDCVKEQEQMTGRPTKTDDQRAGKPDIVTVVGELAERLAPAGPAFTTRSLGMQGQEYTLDSTVDPSTPDMVLDLRCFRTGQTVSVEIRDGGIYSVA